MKVVCEDKGEEAFIQLLIDRNIDESWSWDQVLRDTISNPAYRAIDSMPKRKAAYQRYLEERKKFERVGDRLHSNFCCRKKRGD